MPRADRAHWEQNNLLQKSHWWFEHEIDFLDNIGTWCDGVHGKTKRELLEGYIRAMQTGVHLTWTKGQVKRLCDHARRCLNRLPS